jgi:hypothetical protein
MSEVPMYHVRDTHPTVSRDTASERASERDRDLYYYQMAAMYAPPPRMCLSRGVERTCLAPAWRSRAHAAPVYAPGVKMTDVYHEISMST